MSQQNSDLDLSTVPSEDHERLAKEIEGHYKQDSTVKSALSYHWERNHLMLDGRQWIVYDTSGGRNGMWNTLKVSKANEYIPRPVTNYVFDVYQTLKSYLIQNKPRSTVIPNSQRNKDKQAAKIAELVLEVNWKRLLEEKNYEYAASCGVTYGTVFKKSYWDTTSLQTATVPRMEQVPQIDPASGQPTGQLEDRQVFDPLTGEPAFDELPLGDINTAVVEPYRLALDPLATDLHTARWVMEYQIQPLDWIRETYMREGEGFTGLAETVEPEESLSSQMQRFYQLKTSSGVKLSGSTPGTANNSAEMIENAAVVKEYYERPCRKYPRGRLVVVANGVTLYSGDSPYSGPDQGDWHPYSEFRWEVVPGRFWGKSPLDDTTEIQKHINSIDAAIILTRKTMAVPQKLIPFDSGIKPGEWTGRPGQEVRYRSTGATPTVVPGQGVDQSVFVERQQRLEDMKNISGAIDILKGDRPPGVTAASALEMLFEVGTGKLRPCLDRWKVFVEGDQKKQLKWTCKFYKEPRPEFVKKLMMLAEGKIPEQSIENFIGADLRDNANVKIEAGSNVPKLQSAEKANLMQMAQTGTLNLQNPENQMEFNHRMGVVGFDNRQAPDVERAEWENDLLDEIDQSPDNKPVVLADEDHGVHKEIHLRRMKEPAWISASPAVQQAYQEHMAEHEFYEQQALMMQQMQAAMTGAPVPQQPQGPEPVVNQEAGKGIQPKLQSQINSPDVAGKVNTG